MDFIENPRIANPPIIATIPVAGKTKLPLKEPPRSKNANPTITITIPMIIPRICGVMLDTMINRFQ